MNSRILVSVMSQSSAISLKAVPLGVQSVSSSLQYCSKSANPLTLSSQLQAPPQDGRRFLLASNCFAKRGGLSSSSLPDS